ncbi:MAG: hypothetical protein KJ558_15385 [Gammaproteobacteria bacterium]|nr:hypothetical protein [Gammaproteobacteria bacterium]MBU1961304.1 hypothetical protein [Gammaproteobacteria bacterium]
MLALIFLAVWVLCFAFSPRTRQAMLWTSLIGAPAGPISEYWHLADYWHPEYLVEMAIGTWRFGIEDFVAAFAVGGISAAVFETLALRRGWVPLPGISWGTLVRMELWGIAGLMFMLFFVYGLGLNSIYAIILGLFLSALLLLFGKWQTLLLALPAALTLALLLWLSYLLLLMTIFPGALEAIWKLEVTWGIRLAGIPIEEVLWAFFVGIFTGPFFRVCALGGRRALMLSKGGPD